MNKIEFNLKGKSGIYMFFNTISGKRYVGSSVDLYNRLHEHVHNFKNNTAHNKHFQNAWNKYGEDAFIYCILEYCDPAIRFEREQYYINYIKPEYNLTLNVIANFGHTPSEETKEKISNTLKEKYKSGEISTYKQEHLWETVYIYDIYTYELIRTCKYKADALRFINYKSTKFSETRIYGNRFCFTTRVFKDKNELVNYINEFLLKVSSNFGNYIITEDNNGKLCYHRSLVECAKAINASKSTLNKHSDARKENPYIIRSSNTKFYYSDIYIPVNVDTAVPIEESSEL